MTMHDESRADWTDHRVEELVCRCLMSGDSEAELAKLADEEPEYASRVRAILRRLTEEELVEAVADVKRELQVPERLGEFRLIREIGHGGMGIVYLAEQRTPQRRIALKVIRHEQIFMPGSRERFRREVEAVASLNHPGIVPVFAVGEENGVPYYTMEHVEGCSLADVLRSLQETSAGELTGAHLVAAIGGDRVALPGSPAERLRHMSWADACVDIVRQVAEAVEHAHSRGVLHRDIKPSNILVTHDGRARIVDFGLARTEDAQDLTRSTTQLGSLPYLAPEGISGEPHIPAASLDIYSLGVTLFELLALRNPFIGKNAEETHRYILGGPPRRLRDVNRMVSWDLDTVCLKAIDPNPTHRYLRMADFARDLDNVLARRPIEARRPRVLRRVRRWLQRHPRLATAGLAAAITLLLGSFFYGFRQAQARRRLRREAYAASVLSASLHVGDRASPPEARARLAQCPEDLRGWEWYHLAYQVEESRPLLQLNSEPCCLDWAHDGTRFIVGTRDGRYRSFSPTRAEPLEFIGARPAKFGSCAVRRNGEVFVGQDDGTIRVFDSSTGLPLQQLMDQGDGSPIHVLTLAGEHLVSGDRNGHVVVWDLERGEPLASWKAHEHWITAIAIGGDGARVATAGANRAMTKGEVRVWDVATRTVIDRLEGGGFSQLVVTRDGDWLLAAAGSGLRAKRIAGGAPTVLAKGYISAFAVRDDERQLAVAETGRGAMQFYELTLGDVAKVGFLREQRGFDYFVEKARYQPGGSLLATIGADRVVRIWDPDRPLALQRFGPLSRTVSACSFDESGQRVVAGTWNGGLHVVEPRHERVRDLQSPHRALIKSIAIRDGRLLTVCYGWKVALWSLEADQPDWVLPDELNHVTSAALAGEVLWTGHLDGTVTVWDVVSRSVVRRLKAHDGLISDICLSRDGKRIATTAADGVIRLWNRRFESVRVLRGHRAWVGTARFDAGGEQLFSIGADEAVFVWDLRSGRRSRALAGFAIPPHAIDTGPDSRRVFGAYHGKGIWIWDTVSGKAVARVGAEELAYAICVSPDGKQLASGGDGRKLLIWSSGQLQPAAPIDSGERWTSEPPWQRFCKPR